MPPLPFHASTTRTVVAAGVPTYLRESPGHGPTLLLLPGGALDTVEMTWSEVMDALPARYRIVLPDLPGYGGSGRPGAPTTEWYVGWLGALLDALGLDRPVLAGSSMGGAIALGLALAAPDRVAGLVLSGAYGVQGRVPFHPVAAALVRAPGAARLARAALRRRPVLAALFRLVAVRHGAALTPDLVDDARAGLAPPDALDAFAAWLRDELRPTRCRTDYRAALPGLGVPALVLHGRHDRVLPFGAAEAAARALPRGRLAAFDAGHLPPRERPAEVTAAVRAFVDAVWAPPGLRAGGPVG